MGTSGSYARDAYGEEKLGPRLIDQGPERIARIDPDMPEHRDLVIQGYTDHSRSDLNSVTSPPITMIRPVQSRVTGVAVRSLLVADGQSEMADVQDRSDRAAIKAIGIALTYVPPTQRARWAEEWAADLESITGKFERFRWRWGIRLSSRRMGVRSPAPASSPRL